VFPAAAALDDITTSLCTIDRRPNSDGFGNVAYSHGMVEQSK
jgi:hypothetical protein